MLSCAMCAGWQRASRCSAGRDKTQRGRNQAYSGSLGAQRDRVHESSSPIHHYLIEEHVRYSCPGEDYSQNSERITARTSSHLNRGEGYFFICTIVLNAVSIAERFW